MSVVANKKGFTVMEIVMTLTLSFLVFSALLTLYYWGARVSTLCSKKNRSQVAAIMSSVRIMDCIRNASAISDIDLNGRWVDLSYPDGSSARLAYTNSDPSVDSGAIGLLRSGQDPLWFVEYGITEMMADDGFDSGVFSVQTNMIGNLPDANLIYVRYRVSQPADDGGRDLEDKDYAMHVRFSTSLRNWE